MEEKQTAEATSKSVEDFRASEKYEEEELNILPTLMMLEGNLSEPELLPNIQVWT